MARDATDTRERLLVGALSAPTTTHPI